LLCINYIITLKYILNLNLMYVKIKIYEKTLLGVLNIQYFCRRLKFRFELINIHNKLSEHPASPDL
jgi:hypothetical protein